jgi:hypothetical protein
LRGGLPHSDIPGSPIARISPGLFAACHVLHRLSVPRHPPDALTSRLSATPNGKNHRETRGCSRNLAGRTMPHWPSAPGLDPGGKPGPTIGPPIGASAMHLSARRNKLSPGHSSLLGGTCKAPPLEDTIGIPRTDLSAPATEDPASVTQLAYSHLSINNPPPAVR